MPDPLYIFFCESTIHRIGFVQYSRAASEDAAKAAAAAPGVNALTARVQDESGDWALDAANRNQLGLAAANDSLYAVRSLMAHRPVFWTVFWAVLVAMLTWTVVGSVLWFVFLLASHSR